MRAVLLIATGTFAGLAFWSLAEYVLHRWAFHHRHDDRIRSAVAKEHRLHHREPLRTSAAMRTIGVAGVSAAGAPIVLVAGAVDATTVGVGMWLGWSLGYLAYDQLHWRAHHRIPTTRYTSRLRQRHELHHYGHPQRNFGVTSGFWDRVFGTGQPLTDA